MHTHILLLCQLLEREQVNVSSDVWIGPWSDLPKRLPARKLGSVWLFLILVVFSKIWNFRLFKEDKPKLLSPEFTRFWSFITKDHYNFFTRDYLSHLYYHCFSLLLNWLILNYLLDIKLATSEHTNLSKLSSIPWKTVMTIYHLE